MVSGLFAGEIMGLASKTGAQIMIIRGERRQTVEMSCAVDDIDTEWLYFAVGRRSSSFDIEM